MSLRRRNTGWIGAACIAAAGAGAQPVPPAQAGAAPARIVAVSDVHGAYDAFVELLETVKLVDASLRWIGGRDALVVVGDSVDRGDGSRRVLELLMRLEAAAAANGGRVQLVLGNHEVMNLTGATDYVSAADFAAYAADESAADRDAALARFSAARASAANPPASEETLRAEFARLYPPGYFGQRAAFSPRGEIGSWLLRQPVLLVLGDTAFVHGGLPPALAGRGAPEINAQYGAVLREYTSAFETLRAANVLHDEDAFADRPGIAERSLAAARAAGQTPPQTVAAAYDRLAALTRSAELGDGAVYWYRGSVSCSPAVESDRVARFLAGLGVARAVVGHTPTGTGALSRFDGTLLRVDTGMQQRGGRATAIVLQGAQAGAVYAGDAAVKPIPAQPRTVGAVQGLDDAALADVLHDGDLTVVAKERDGTRVRITSGGRGVDARFTPAASGKRSQRFAPEVAAYRLDRMLGLELVPVAVLREVDGNVGVLRLDQSGLPDEERRAAEREGAGAWCPLRDQFALMYLFDSLAGNEGRRGAEMRYEAASWQLVLTGNARLFGANASLPAYLRATPLNPSPSLAARLRALDAKSLTAQLGDVLDAKRIESLLARRDALLARRPSN